MNELERWWEAKYKTCRAAFVEMGRIHRHEEREQLKFLQRIQQLAYDGQKLGGRYAADDLKSQQLEKIRQAIIEHIKERVA